jgi:hypothetical protein
MTHAGPVLIPGRSRNPTRSDQLTERGVGKAVHKGYKPDFILAVDVAVATLLP